MSGINGKEYVVIKDFNGLPTDANYEIKEFELPALKEGEYAVEVLFLSVDPYMRIPGFQVVGQRAIGEGVGKVVQSKNDEIPVGKLVIGKTGWATHVIGDETFRVLPETVSQLSLFLGTLGMPGLTAFMQMEKCEPKAGEVFFVNASAGAVGSVVGQMAKRRGCTVVGCAGSEEKVTYLKEIGFDHAFNYKTVDFAETMKATCPKGIDCFVDHVGGKQFDVVTQMMNWNGRVCITGSISAYNATEVPLGPYVHMATIGKELTIKGLAVFAHYHRFPELYKDYIEPVAKGEIKVREHFYHGFDKMLEAFLSLFSGAHIGKVVVKL